MLSDEDILRRLRAIRFSPKTERNARRAASINGVAAKAGISREHVHRIVNGSRPLTQQTRQALGHALTCDRVNGEKSRGRPPSPCLASPRNGPI